MEKQQIKELLEFLLNSFRAQLAVQPSNSSGTCPFDFQNFLMRWKPGRKSGTGMGASTALSQLVITLNSVIAQGLLDSILPYLTAALGLPRNTCSSSSVQEIPSNSNAVIKFRPENNRKSESPGKGAEDCEIAIHVCDESRGLREDFHFQQSTLTKEMGYFTHVAVKGQRLRDLDISVHCDLNVFDWLMGWMSERGQLCLTPNPNKNLNSMPSLDARNVIGIVVSADFLQMPILVSECLDFIHQNIEQVVSHSPNLSCLSESLVKKLGGYFRHLDLERRIVKLDRTDRLTSRLFIQHILGLNSPGQDLDFMSAQTSASTETLFRCQICQQLLTNPAASKIMCAVTRLDSRGRVFACHVTDPSWTLTNHIRELKRELKTWRRVYWRLWGTVNFFKCVNCGFYFPARGLGTCRFHPDYTNRTLLSIPTIEEKLSYARMARNFGGIRDDAQSSLGHLVTGSGSPGNEKDIGASSTNSSQNSTDTPPSQPYTKYRCCQVASYKYSPHPRISGCETKDHVAYDELAENWTILEHFRELIVDENLETHWETLGGKIQLRPPGGQNQPKDILSSSTTTNATKSSKYSIFMRTSVADTPGCARESSSTDSDESEASQAHSHAHAHRNSRKIYSQLDQTKNNNSWIWNPDLSTRYNQDMQREREETYMISLAAVLVQRVPLESTKFQFFRRRAPKEDVGGSFARLEHDFLA